MMLFHVPSNVSSFINCGSKSSCENQEVMGGFTAWYSCPVCAYRSLELQTRFAKISKLQRRPLLEPSLVENAH